MKTQLIKVNRIFLDTKEYVKEQLIRLESKSLSSLFNRFAFKIISLSLRSSRKISNRIQLYHKFGLYLLSMNRRHGSTYVVKYLKACSLALSKAVAGQPFSSLREIEPDLPLPRLSKSGLPRIIGTRDRKAILSGSTKVIRLYLSLFNLYRVISIEVKPKLSTITDPYSGSPNYLASVGSWFTRNSRSVIEPFLGKWEVASHRYLPRETASPTNKKSWQGLVLDAYLIANDSEIYSAFVDYCSATKSTLIDYIHKISPYVSEETSKLLPRKEKASFGLGQLSTKVEPAGKLRVFAIVDGWTQSLLRPLHSSLFGVLKNIPNDGTHSHTEAFERAVSKAIKANCAYGYDLSAATDRLPIDLQVAILASLIGEAAANAWKRLLIGRPYRLWKSDEVKTLFDNQDYIDFRYAVGQPMGALSSWAMLAITHHMIMQYCAKLVNPISRTWDERYEIVGDDIIIFDKSLADKYLEVMAELGVPINQSKSVVSVNKPVVEFVKRTSVGNKEVSPIQWNMFINQDTWRGRISTALGLFLREKSFTDKPFAVLNTILASALWDKRPNKDSVSLVALMNAYITKMSYVAYLLRLIRATEPMIVKGKMYFANFNFDFSRNAIASMIKGRSLPRVPKKDGHYLLFEWAVKEVLRARLAVMIEKYNDLWVEKQVNRHVDAVLGTFPKKDALNFRFYVRNIFFTYRPHHLTLWNELILDDPKTGIDQYLAILEKKMNDVSSWELVDRINDPSPKLQKVEVNTCEVLQLVVKGFNQQWKSQEVDRNSFDADRFFQFVRKETNWKDLSKMEGFEILNEFKRSR